MNGNMLRVEEIKVQFSNEEETRSWKRYNNPKHSAHLSFQRVLSEGGQTHTPPQSAPPFLGSQSSGLSTQICLLSGHLKPAKPPHNSSFTQIPVPSHSSPQPDLYGSFMQIYPVGHGGLAFPRPPPQTRSLRESSTGGLGGRGFGPGQT